MPRFREHLGLGLMSLGLLVTFGAWALHDETQLGLGQLFREQPAPPREIFVVLGALIFVLGMIPEGLFYTSSLKQVRRHAVVGIGPGAVLFWALYSVTHNFEFDDNTGSFVTEIPNLFYDMAVFLGCGTVFVVLVSFILPGKRKFPKYVPALTDEQLKELVPREESWRQPTGMRFAEKLKNELERTEEQLVNAVVVDRWFERELVKGRQGDSAYNASWLNQRAADWHDLIPKVQGRIAALKLRIQKVLDGKVGDEIAQLDVDIKKLERERRDIEQLPSAQDHAAKLREIDDHLIELRVELEELRQWQAQDREKTHYERHRSRRFYDRKDEIDEFQEDMYGARELLKAYKALDAEFRDDPDLTATEQDELRSMLRKQYEAKAQKAGFSIYEEA